MRIDIVTIFPEMFSAFLRTGVLGRAVGAGILNVQVHDLRDYAGNPHRSVDDEPYGGGGGMVMTAPPWIAAIRALSRDGSPRRILMTPQGRRLDNDKVIELAQRAHIVLLCGRYEGIDERVREMVVDEEVSIGDYVLSGGEVPSMVLIESVSRELPGVVGLPQSVEQDSFRDGLLDYPHYTRPRVVEGLAVPDVLRSGHHGDIDEWRRRRALEITQEKRPDLLEGRPRSPRAGGRACGDPLEEK